MRTIFRNIICRTFKTEKQIQNPIRPIILKSPQIKGFKQNLKLNSETSTIKQLLNNFAIRNRQLEKISQFFGLSDIVRSMKLYKMNQEQVNFSGDYKVQLKNNFIHALYLNRQGASDFYFTLNDLNTTQSEYRREKNVDL